MVARTTASVSGKLARWRMFVQQFMLGEKSGFGGVRSHFLRYAETMDDEPDVMNDTALRSVVTCAPACARYSAASHTSAPRL